MVVNSKASKKRTLRHQTDLRTVLAAETNPSPSPDEPVTHAPTLQDPCIAPEISQPAPDVAPLVLSEEEASTTQSAAAEVPVDTQPNADSPADEAAVAPTPVAADRLEIVSKVEPFLDFDVAALRHKLIDDLVIEKQLQQILAQVGPEASGAPFKGILRVLAEMKAEIHYLKAAYIEHTRYKDPRFEIEVPQPKRVLTPDVIDIDLRGEITGSNWWQAEPDGRWAGPENQSSLQFPAMGPGLYTIDITVLSDIDSGVMEQTQISLNRQPVGFIREGNEFPCRLWAQVHVAEDYRFPFWTLKFDFHRLTCPREKGFPDDRKLAIKVRNIRIARA